MMRANQPNGFDCPGCAWGDDKPTSVFEFCENGVKAVAWEATSKRCTPEFFAKHSVSWLAEQSGYFLESQGRLTDPMVYNAETDHYEPITWDGAFGLIAEELGALNHPDEALFYTSGRTSNEAAFMWQLLVREFGTNNLPDCSNMCHEASGVALKESIGIGKGAVMLEDMVNADAIFLFGQNPGTNHPRMLGQLRELVARGGTVVTVNPMKERGLEHFVHPQSPKDMLGLSDTRISEMYLRPQPGGDLALLKGIMRLVIEADDAAQAAGAEPVLDWDFINAHCHGFDVFAADIRAESWNKILAQSGVPMADITAAADVYMQAKSVICTWAMGITQHTHGVETIQYLMNFLLLRGNIGRPGTGPCPVRGHSNVQGDRTMGITELPTDEFLDSLKRVFGFEPPREHGVNTVEAIQAMADGKAKVLLAMGGNFAGATPDYDLTWKAIQSCNLTVHVSTKLNRSHVIHGKNALILPTLGRTEIDEQNGKRQKITVEDSMSMVHASEGVNRPASDNLRSEPWIISGMAQALFPDSKVPWEQMRQDYGFIREKIEAVFADFEDYNEKILREGGFWLGNSAKDREWKTDSGKANFMVHDLPEALPREAAQNETAEKVFTLTTFRSHDQYNTTVYDLNDRYRGIKGDRDIFFINPDDRENLGLPPGAVVSAHGVYADGRERSISGFKLLDYDMPAGVIGSYYPETNALIPLDAHGPRSGTPSNKAVAIVLKPEIVES